MTPGSGPPGTQAPPRVAVLDYGAGNIRSAHQALVRAGADAFVTQDAAEAAEADALFVPGVGHFGQCVRQFSTQGFEGLAEHWVDAGRPLLGVCVGMQILYESSDEAPGEPGLGLLRGHVRRLPAETVPHMGWNTVEGVQPDPVLEGVSGQQCYFVHSYYAEAARVDNVVATCDYGVSFAAVTRVGSVVATQFHPEKSSDVGARLLSNWMTEIRATRVRS